MWPVLKCFYLPLDHQDADLTDDITEEVDGVLMEFTLFKFQAELELTELMQDLLHVVAKFGQVPGVYQDIINVGL